MTGQKIHMELLVTLLHKMIHDPIMPEIPPELTEIEGIAPILEQMDLLREILNAFSRGDFSPDINLRGILAGRLKTLQANLLHLCWQIKQVSDGDFSQRVDFLGEFSTSFNSMVTQLDTALTSLRHKEEELTNLTSALQREVEEKAEALLALSRSESRFRHMAEHDALTGVCNRRSFYDLAVMELERARNARELCALMMFDIDHFKKFNDTYGHLEGDNALRHVTQTIKRELREQDIFGRYGGEEFVLLIPHIDTVAGKLVAERLRIAVCSSPVSPKTVGSASVSISVGVVFVPPDGEEIRKVSFLEKFLGFADGALYEAKNSGRNTYRVHSGKE